MAEQLPLLDLFRRLELLRALDLLRAWGGVQMQLPVAVGPESGLTARRAMPSLTALLESA